MEESGFVEENEAMGNQPEVRRFTKIWLVGGIVALALLAILIGKTGNERGWTGYLRLMQQGSNCEAVITGTEPSGRCLAAYSFSVAGRDYFGTGPDCSARVGQKVIVTYLVSNPSHSCLGYAGERLADEVVSFLFGGLGFPPLS